MRGALVLVAAAAAFTPARARAQECQPVAVGLLPSDGLQIVVWVEDADGRFVDTLFVTDAIGRHGLGNRPGHFDLHTGYRWHAGRRETTFPVWAHRRGVVYPKVIHQANDEETIECGTNIESYDPYYCDFHLELDPFNDPMAGCESDSWSGVDLGKFSATELSLYPPRADLTPSEFGPFASPDVASFAAMNDLDAISGATPAGGARFGTGTHLPPGDWVIWVEVSKELDQNASYDFPGVGGQIPSYGIPYRGQPSVVWRVPVHLAGAPTSALTFDYAGYGAPDGADGVLRPPDATIDDADGTGAGRLLVDANSDWTFWRVRVDAGVASTAQPVLAAAIEDGDLVYATPRTSAAQTYEVRFSRDVALTAENFTSTGTLVTVSTSSGGIERAALDLPTTPGAYWAGVAARDACNQTTRPLIVAVVVPEPDAPPVDAWGCQVGRPGRTSAAGAAAMLGMLWLLLLTGIATPHHRIPAVRARHIDASHHP